MKTHNILFLAISLLATASNAVPVTTEVDVTQYRAGIASTSQEFVPCRLSEMDQSSIERGWRYALRYILHEPGHKLSFSLALVRASTPDQFVLAMYQGNQPTLSEYIEADDLKKIQLAKKSKIIDQALAQALYQAWANSLIRATYGNSANMAMDGEYYYLSVFSVDGGFMCASSGESQAEKTTGKIRELGLLLKSYLEESNAETSEQIASKILAKAALITRP